MTLRVVKFAAVNRPYCIVIATHTLGRGLAPPVLFIRNFAFHTCIISVSFQVFTVYSLDNACGWCYNDIVC